ncbi:MAG: ROK family protein [Chloroflexota bacterium]|nr:ROK family protein [Chloroflexota bacterium]
MSYPPGDAAPAQHTPASHALGIDVGGTKIAAGVVALDTGQVLRRRLIPTDAERGGEAILADALDLTHSLLGDAQSLGIEPAAVGVGVAELVDAAGEIHSAHSLGWRGMPVRERFSAILPTVVESDVRAAALAEARFGAGRGCRLFAFVTVGTGISSSLVQDGLPIIGARGNALVLGTMPLSTICSECGAALRPVLEEIASGPALAARYRAKGGNARRGEDVLASAAKGDTRAKEVVRIAGQALGSSVAFLVNVTDPEAVVVGGGLGSAGGHLWESFVPACRAHIYADATRLLPILQAALGPDAGLIGAAAASSRALATEGGQ